jgi:hypothetical protein
MAVHEFTHVVDIWLAGDKIYEVCVLGLRPTDMNVSAGGWVLSNHTVNRTADWNIIDNFKSPMEIKAYTAQFIFMILAFALAGKRVFE